ncbi:cell division protein ZapA [Saccharophagus sp. K07]|jgi:cell division protein ZapA|uniref:cell division protein ZapA n=1 Tax=Saccharophagus sp. K07 TaxID=2283636 RepID=UPI001652AA5F|nr:cell division protein ZapA [Saccharophagus sp. K07]MBC6906398.1 cell division protein ZapA [Saccharophagus sp. K07]
MSHDSKRVNVRILDKDYQVACRAEEKDALLLAARELDQRMRQVRNAGPSVLGTDRIAVMVALNLCHELQQERRKTAAPAEQSAALERLAEKLDGALNP